MSKLVGAIAPEGLSDALGGTIHSGVLPGLVAVGTGKWSPVSTVGPAALIPLYSPDNPNTPWAAPGVATIAPVSMDLRYTPDQPPTDGLDPDTQVSQPWQPAHAGGICFFDRAGTWWVLNPNRVDVPLPYALVPVADGAAFNRLIQFGLVGNHRISTQVTLPANGAPAFVRGWDFRRRKVLIVNNAGAAATLYVDPATLANTALLRVIPLANGGTVTFAEGDCPWMPISAERAAAGAAVNNGLLFVESRL